MENQIEKTENNKIALVSDNELLMHLGNLGLLKDLTEGEKNSYLQIAKAFNLNPFKREIHVSKYNGVMSIITGYEVYIKRAERSGLLDGWECTTTGSVETNDLKAIITIYRKDRKYPFKHEVEFSEYAQKTREGKLTKFWEKAKTMTKKVAMSQGFRLCFSDELGGMPYTKEEMPEQTTDEINYTDVTEIKKQIPDLFKTLEEKIEDAKAILIVANKENFGSLWKTLSNEMQTNEDVIAFGKEMKDKLGIVSYKR